VVSAHVDPHAHQPGHRNPYRYAYGYFDPDSYYRALRNAYSATNGHRNAYRNPIMSLIIPSLIITFISAFIGMLLGIFIGRKKAGLVDEWDGWAAQIDFLMLIFRGK
jgi:ABC-type dipeptide/oligopeptide/nickel transport system permease component